MKSGLFFGLLSMFLVSLGRFSTNYAGLVNNTEEGSQAKQEEDGLTAKYRCCIVWLERTLTVAVLEVTTVLD